MSLFKSLLIVGGVVGGGYYLNKKTNLLERVRGLALGNNSNYQLTDFYKPFEPTSERVHAAITATKRNALDPEGWKEETKKYKLLSNELADKLNKLNRLPKQEAQFGEGQQIRSEIEAIADELNKLEKAFGTTEIQRGAD
jgi:hypothetical protein